MKYKGLIINNKIVLTKYKNFINFEINLSSNMIFLSF